MAGRDRLVHFLRRMLAALQQGVLDPLDFVCALTPPCSFRGPLLLFVSFSLLASLFCGACCSPLLAVCLCSLLRRWLSAAHAAVLTPLFIANIGKQTSENNNANNSRNTFNSKGQVMAHQQQPLQSGVIEQHFQRGELRAEASSACGSTWWCGIVHRAAAWHGSLCMFAVSFSGRRSTACSRSAR